MPKTDREVLEGRVLHEWRAMGRMSGVSVFPLTKTLLNYSPTAVMFEIVGFPELSLEEYEAAKKEGQKFYCCEIGVDLREMDTITTEAKMADLIRIRWMSAMIAMWETVHRERCNGVPTVP
jgi:hypothetical protein